MYITYIEKWSYTEKCCFCPACPQPRAALPPFPLSGWEGPDEEGDRAAAGAGGGRAAMAAGKSQAGGGPGCRGAVGRVAPLRRGGERRTPARGSPWLSLSDCPARKEGPSVTVPQRRSLSECPSKRVAQRWSLKANPWVIVPQRASLGEGLTMTRPPVRVPTRVGCAVAPHCWGRGRAMVPVPSAVSHTAPPARGSQEMLKRGYFGKRNDQTAERRGRCSSGTA